MRHVFFVIGVLLVITVFLLLLFFVFVVIAGIEKCRKDYEKLYSTVKRGSLLCVCEITLLVNNKMAALC